MQSPTYILLNSSCLTAAELESFQLQIHLTIPFSAGKFVFFTKTLSVCPPSRVTSRLDKAASTSSISGSLEWSRVSLDKVSLQMWYWGNRTDLTSPQRFIITPKLPEKQEHEEGKVLIWHDFTRGAAAGMSQAEVWRPATASVCGGEAHHNLNHNPTACKTPSELIRNGSNVDKKLSDFVPLHASSSVFRYPSVPVSSSTVALWSCSDKFWNWIIVLNSSPLPQDAAWGFSSETYPSQNSFRGRFSAP